ncbi:helix-turn-helix domain-containing protein [Streptomyces sp. NPDC002851]
MSGATGAGGNSDFATLLRELKDRSGLSYGALAKRLHMSTSTLHRYCSGSAVPNEYAPAERLARLCRATPEELVELHRRWILADAARGRRGEQAGAAAATGAPGPLETSGLDPHPQPESDPDPDPDPEPEPESESEPVAVDVPRPLAPPSRRRRTALFASATAAAAVLGAVALAMNPPSGGGVGEAGDHPAAGTTAGADAKGPSSSDSAAPSPTGKGGKGGKGGKPFASASGSAAESGKATPGAGKDGGKQGGGEPTGNGTAVPLNVATRPYVYDDPCAQHFLVDSAPEQVGPPANEQDAPRWAAAYGAVSSGEQRVALTVQGTGKDTVVLEALHVRVVSKNAPLAWNDYAMGVGCGGGVETKSFDIDLDNGSPTVTVKNGQRDFPYKVSESDPEVFYITAHSTAHDVRWDLTLDWSSGNRHGTVHIDNNDTPFRTSANVGRPGYDYPLGGGEWIERKD